LLVARQQTAGRGRLGKSWVTPAGTALTFSLGLPMHPPTWSGLSLAVGLTLAETLDPDGRKGLGLKWPNDLWHWPPGQTPAKLGGILIETLPLPGQQARYVIVGVGINCRSPDIDTGAIPPRGLDHWGPAPTAGDLLALLAAPLLQTLQSFERHGPAATLAGFDRRDLLRGREIHTSQGLSGVAQGIDAQGALRVLTAQGTVAIDSAEVSVRPAQGLQA
jgi:BirA family biotin operon repressor/biotin-[acetyl-CoA-carboxylase] ligase